MSKSFDQLIQQIEMVHSESQKFAIQQVNFSLTMRNIIIGFQIVEYEQKGSDRALYGENTIKKIAEHLKHIKGISVPQLYRFRAFYVTYPQIFSAVMIKLQSVDYGRQILPTLSEKLSWSHFIEHENSRERN